MHSPLPAQQATRISRITLTGGGAQSRAVREIARAVFGLPVASENPTTQREYEINDSYRRTAESRPLPQPYARAGLNVGYLSQVENDKASPSLETLAALADALDVPIAWFLLDQSIGPRMVRAAERPQRTLPDGAGAMTQVDGGIARDIAIFEARIPAGERTGFHEHPGDEHHIVMTGRIRITQGEAVVEAGPGDYVLLDGTLPHDAEALGDEPARLLIVYPRGGHSELTRSD